MDFGKFKFDEAQRAKESRRKATSSSIKEMKYRPKIGIGDFDTKTRQVTKFLGEGHKVKITIMFRGREMSHPELGKKLLDQVAEQVGTIAKIEAAPKLDGRNMIMVLAPDRRSGPQVASAPRSGTRPGSRLPTTPIPTTQAPTTATGPTPVVPANATAAPAASTSSATPTAGGDAVAPATSPPPTSPPPTSPPPTSPPPNGRSPGSPTPTTGATSAPGPAEET